MYERFTAESLSALRAAQEIAQGLDNEYMDISHFLCGLISRGAPVSEMIKALGADPRTLQTLIHGSIGRGMFSLFYAPKHSAELNHAIDRAIQMADEMGHNGVTPVHLLMGVLEDPWAAAFLAQFNITLKRVRQTMTQSTELAISDV